MTKSIAILLVGIFTVVSPSAEASGDENRKMTRKGEAQVANPPLNKALIHQGVFFKNLKDGQRVPKKFKVKFGVVGMVVKPAGTLEVGTGHHHILVDMDNKTTKSGFPTKQVIPSDAKHIHFGKGQTETMLELSPGKHTLTLQFANAAHQSYGKEWSKTITVYVQK